MNKDDINKIVLKNISFVSNEIKDPVVIMSAAIKLLRTLDRMDALTLEDVRTNLECLYNNCNKLERMLNNVRSYCNVTVSDYHLIEPKVFAENFAKALEKYEIKYGFKFKYNISTKDEQFKIPVFSVECILLNLIVNSVQYNHKKQKRVSMSIGQNDEYYIFSISDNGNGIPEEYISETTDIFFRRESNGFSRIGAGLSLVEKIVEAIGGTLTIKSKSKKGTEVTFSIPIKTNGVLQLRDHDYQYKPSTSFFETEFSALNKDK